MRHLISLFFLLPVLSLAQWSPLGTGMLSNRSMTSASGDLYAATYPNGVKKSVNGTGPWTAVNTGLPESGGVWYVQSVGTDGSFLYAGTQSGIYRSVVGTDTWAAANGTLAASENVYANKFFAFGGSIMAVFTGTIGEGGGIWRSSNQGTTWLIGHSGMGSNAIVYHLTQVGADLWASTSTGLWRSTDNAQSWTLQPGVNYAVYSLAAIGNRLVIASNFGIRYSVNGGADWTDATGDPASPTNGELVAFSGNLYALFDAPAGCLRSLDNGTTWSDFNTGLSAIDQTAQEEFFVSGITLYCTALFDIYSITGTNVGTSEQASIEAIKVYPTVFDATLTITGVEQHMTVELVDASGKTIRSYRNPGASIIMDRSGLPAGLYLLCVRSAGNIFEKNLRVIAQ
jgi:hypothetical protein